MSEYIQDPSLQKCALKIAATGELVALGAYRDMPQGFLVYVEAKTPEIRERYIRDFGAIPFSRREPFFCF